MAVDDQFTKSLLHCDGADTSTTFTDESGKTWTARGNAQIDTAQSKFGGASGLFDGTGDWVDTPDHADFYVAAAEWTVDLWFRLNATGIVHRFCGQGDATSTMGSRSIEIAVTAGNKLSGLLAWGTGASDYTQIIGGTNLTTGVWYHAALVRVGDTLMLFLNGISEGTADITGKTANNSTTVFSVGAIGIFAGNPMNGWIDEFRFTKGYPRWNANFSPPSVPYAPAAGSFLMLMD